MPEWAQGTDAAELAIAELLGAWTEKSEADKAAAERLSKKAYGEWIEKMREIVHRPGTPLIQRDGVWRMVARYEGWYALGSKLFDEHIDRFKETVVSQRARFRALRRGNYEEQQKELEERRQKAILEVFTDGGVDAILEFAKAVKSPWRVGYYFGVVAAKESDNTILPDLLDSEIKALGQFTGGFVWGRFRILDWQWVDEIDTSSWSAKQKGQFLAYLPFKPATWSRAAQLLSGDEAPYWSRANANPYEPENNLEFAIDRLVEHGRTYPAVRCLQKILFEEKPLESQQAVRVLKAVLGSSEDPRSLDVDAIVAVITALQQNPDTNPDDLFQIEWAFLPVLDRHHGASPRALEQRLADDPDFFCEVIRLVYRRDESHMDGLCVRTSEFSSGESSNAFYANMVTSEQTGKVTPYVAGGIGLVG
jgi:hypothetical protein